MESPLISKQSAVSSLCFPAVCVEESENTNQTRTSFHKFPFHGSQSWSVGQALLLAAALKSIAKIAWREALRVGKPPPMSWMFIWSSRNKTRSILESDLLWLVGRKLRDPPGLTFQRMEVYILQHCRRGT